MEGDLFSVSIFKKSAGVLLLLCLILSALSPALAAETSQGGLSLSLSLDTSSLAEGETLLADVRLTSGGETAYRDISITLDVPGTLFPVEGAQLTRSAAGLPAGGSLSLSALLLAVPDPTAAVTPPSLPGTGDSARPARYVLLLALCAAGLAGLSRPSRRRLLALLLCAAAAGPGVAPSARADGDERITLRVSETVTVMGQETEITAVVRATPVRTGENTRELRALYIIEDDFPGGYSGFPNEYRNNTALLRSMLSKATPSGLPFAAEYACRNQTQEELFARIAALAGEQDEGDVALFYITCHGMTDPQEKGYTNELYLSDGSKLHVSDLADALAAVPGRVIVVLDYCGSGMAIGRSAQPAADDAYMQFARQALGAFAAADLPVQADAQRDGSFLVPGKFVVITGASGTQSSWTNTERGSYLLQWMDSGVMDADTDGNGTVTLREMGLYLQEQGQNKAFFEYGQTVHMIPQFYPESGRYPLFVR